MGGVVLLFVMTVLFLMARKRSALRVRQRQAFNFKPDNKLGGARYAKERDLRIAGLFRKRGVPIGYAPNGRHSLWYGGAGHLLTVAAARTGKGATLLVNALLAWTESCIVIDPKAELAAISGHFRNRLGKVYILNPFGILKSALNGLTTACLNPMDILDPASVGFHASCDKLANSCVWETGTEGKYFTDGARMLVSGVIAALVRFGKPVERNLPAVLTVISGDICGFCEAIISKSHDPYINQKLGRFAQPEAKESREILDVIATAITQLHFVANEAIAESLKRSDFLPSDLKRKKGITVYICLPLHMLDVTDKYFRLILETFLSDLLNVSQGGVGRPVLAIIDEMAQLGPHVKSLENAMGMAAGAAGIQLWCVLQDLSQLKGMFPKTWETFIQNCGVTTWFGARDQTTREYVSKLAGTTEVLTTSRSVSFDQRTKEPIVNHSYGQYGRPLILPHEAGQLGRDEMIAFVEGVTCGPVRAKRKFYFKVLHGRFRPNPYVRKG
jgi:type IV secretion system protein VirD4